MRFRVVLFWTELKPTYQKKGKGYCFRVVLFWTELKRRVSIPLLLRRFRVVLFWTELKQYDFKSTAYGQF